MKYPKRKDQYNCELLCENFHEIDHRLKKVEEQNAAESDVEVDETLTISGAAADSKVVGDKITEINTNIGNVEILLSNI